MWIKENFKLFFSNQPYITMKLFKSTIGILIIAMLSSSCGTEDKKSEVKSSEERGDKMETTTDANPVAKLEGAWVIMRAEGIAIKSNLGTVYTFKGDNLTMGKDGFDNPGKTEITDSTFSFQGNNNAYKFIFYYRFEGDTLIASMENSNGQHFYMVKK